MAFFDSKAKFPPGEWAFWYNKYEEWAAWYSGDEKILYDYYHIKSIGDIISQSRMWARIDDFTGVIHLPAANDIASTSANLLFSEVPKFKYDESSQGGQRIKEFISENGFENLLLEGAELSAAMSGCLLKIDIEPDLLNTPIVSVLTPQQFFPVFWCGRLWEVMTFRVVKTNDTGKVWRLFEKRSRQGKDLLIEYELYEGSSSLIGTQIDLNSLEETANIELENVRFSNIDGLGCIYIPNKRPNKLVPGSYLGINDYSISISMMDSLDVAWTSWLRDIELGMAQIFIDEELLTKNQNQTTGEVVQLNKFSKYQRAFVKLNLTGWKMGGDSGVKPIEQIQFNIRMEEHKNTCEQIFFNIVTQCGYSPQTFGIGQHGNVASGTALKILEHKSQLTRETKGRYWIPSIKELFYQLQKIDQSANLSSFYNIEDISIELQDSIITDQKEVSEVIRNLDMAKAVSSYTKVKMQHSDWGEEAIEKEVDQILKEQGITPEVI